MPLLRSPSGTVVNIPDDQAGSAQAAGYEPVSLTDAAQTTAAPEVEDRGALGTFNALATGALSGATLGASDYLLKGILNQGQGERLSAEREEHPVASGIGQVAGAILPAIAAPESLLGRMPSGIVGHATADAVAAGRAIGGVEGIGRALAAGGVEGAIQNAGMYLSDTALGDRELSAEGLAASLGPGFAFGVGGGIAALGIEQGTIAARRLFSRAAGTDKAAQAAESAWATQYQSTVEANDAAADIARAKLAEARAAREQAQLAKQQAEAQKAEVKLRPAPGSEGPRAPLSAEAPPVPQPVEIAGLLHDRAMAAMDPAKLAAWDAENGTRLAEMMRGTAKSPLVLEEATAATAKPGGIDWGAIEKSAAMSPEELALQDRALLSKAQEEELAAAVAEHDAARADLDDILRRIEAPAIEPGVRPPEYSVPVAEWGPPGMKGYDPGNVPAPGPPSELAAETGQATAVGKKKLAEGTPNGAADVVSPAAPPSADKPIEEMSIDEVDKFQNLLKGKFDEVPSGSREYVELSRQWDDAVARRMELETGKKVVRVVSDAGVAKPLDENEFESFAKSWQSTLDPKAVEAMQTYTANGAYSHINGPLRLGEGLPGVRSDSLREAVPVLDAAIAGAPAPRDMVVFRGVTGRRSTKEWNDVVVGDSVVDRGFGSTSSMPHVGASYATGLSVRPGVELRISVPKGYPAAPVPSEIFGAEREILLPRDTKYTVTKIVPHDNGRVVFVTAGPAAEGEASRVAAVIRRDAKSIDELTLPELEDRETALRDARDKIRRAKGFQSEEYKAANAEFERAYQRRQDIKSGRVPEPKDEPIPTSDTTGTPAAATDTLTGQLRGMASKLNEGAELGTLSKESPAAAEYASQKLAKREADAAFFRARAKGKTPEADAFFREPTRPKTRDAYVAQNIGRAMREEGSHAAALAKVEREWAEMGGAPAGPRVGSPARGVEESVGGHPVSTKAVPDAVEDVAAVAQAATRYEKSSARLAEALGPDAPPAAQESAKAFREAEDHAERKTMERTTRAIDDHAEAQAKRPDVAVARKVAPAPAAPEAPDWLDEARRLSGKVEFTPEQRALRDKQFREWEMNAAKGDVQRANAKLTKARAAETEAKIGARNAKDFAQQAREAAMKARPVAAEAAPTSTLGAIATTIGVAGELGVPGIPKPHDIPIIGPLLGTYLKYRAIKAAAGRFVGRIPATGDARAAALVAKTKDKIATAVDRTLGLAAELAPKARAPLVATAAALGHRLIDDGEPDAPKNANAQQQAAVRIREIANAATQPGLVTALVRKELRGVTDPDLIAAAEQHLMARFEALNRVMPKAPPPNPYSKREWVPSPAAAHDVAQRLAVVHDPEAAFHDTTPAKAETLRDTWPRLLEFAQQRLIERVGDLKHPVPYQNRLRNSLLFSVPLDDSMQPDHAAVLQSANVKAQPMQPPAGPGAPVPSIAGNSNLTALYQTASDRRAMR